jgi:hypothetical protein
MKNKNLPTIAMILAIGLLSGCGKTQRYNPVTSSSTPVVTPVPTPVVPVPPVTPTPTPTGTAPLSYEFTKKGQENFVTGTITTDNVLKVKFRVTAEQGNLVWKASELKVTIRVNGYEVTPTYTSANYIYGRVGETSNVMDISQYITPGVPATITVTLPMNDFYCTYWGGYYYDLNAPYMGTIANAVNPQYGQYPGCRKEVVKQTTSANGTVIQGHNWSGVLTVQTSNTTAI